VQAGSSSFFNVGFKCRVSRFLLLVGEPFLAANASLSGFLQQDSDRVFSSACFITESSGTSRSLPVIAKISQETLAEMIGTTRSRVSFFLNRFRDLGYIDYNPGGMRINSSLVNVVLND